MNSQDRKEENNNNPSSQQDLLNDDKKKKLKRQSSENKRGPSNGPNNKKIDIWQRNEMEKHRKMKEENQKRMKENTLKEKNELNKAEREQQEILEKLKKEKREQYEKYLRTNIRQNDQNYQKQKPIENVYKNIDIIKGYNNDVKENFESEDTKKGLKQWVPRPVPLEDADKHLKEQKIEQELYENQMRQKELEKMLEDKKMLDMYKNLPKPKNKKRQQSQPIEEDEQDESSSFQVEGESNLYIDSENESQIRKKRKQNEYPKQQMKSPSYATNHEKKQQNKNSNNKQDSYVYEQQISIVEDQYDFNGGDRNKTPDMLGFEAYNQQVKVKIQNDIPKKKFNEIDQKQNNKDKQNQHKKGTQSSPPQQKKNNDAKQSDQKRNVYKEDNNNQVWDFEGEEYSEQKKKKEPYIQKILPNGMTNDHKQVVLSQDFQRIKFEIEGEDRGESRQSEKPILSQNYQQKPTSSQSTNKNQIQQYQSEMKRQLDQKDLDLLKLKQEQLIKEKKEQKLKDEELEKQKKQYLQQFYKSQEKDSANDQKSIQNKDLIIQEFKHQFNDLKKQYNYHRQQTNQTSKSNLPTVSNENSQTENQSKKQKKQNLQNQNNQRYEQQSIIKSPLPEQDEFLEQADYDYDQQSKHQSLNQSGKVVRRTNYLKDVSKFSLKSQPPIEKPSYSKNQKERRKFWERKTNEAFLNQSIEDKATITAISRFKSKLQNNINVDKQLNNDSQEHGSPKTNEQKKEIQEWQKLNEQELKLQKEILQIHIENLDKVKEVEDKNQINTTHNLSQNLSQLLGKGESKSRINTAVSNKSNVTQKTSKTNKNVVHKELHGKNINKQINPISEIENEDDIEASLMNIDNKLSDQKNRINLMTAEIEQSLKPKNPQLRKELQKNPQILQSNPFTVDITSIDKDYLEEEKQKFLTPIANNPKNHSKLNISHISSITNSKDPVSHRPISNKTNITSNQINSLAKILPSQITNSQSSLQQDKLPRIQHSYPSTIEPIPEKSRLQNIGTSQSQISRQSKLSTNQSSNPATLISKNIQNNNQNTAGQVLQQKASNDNKDTLQSLKNKEMELRKKFPDFFADEAIQPQQVDNTPNIKHKSREQESSSSVSSRLLSEKQQVKKQFYDERDENSNFVMQSYNIQPDIPSQPKRQESSKSLNKKKQPQQELRQVNNKVVENDKEDLKQWWNQVKKSIERSYENTPSQRLVDEQNNTSALIEDKKSSPLKKQIKQDHHSQQSSPYIIQENQKEPEDFNNALQNFPKKEQKKQIDQKIEIAQQSEQKQQNEQKIKSELADKEERKKILMKKFMEECEEDDKQEDKTKLDKINQIENNNKEKNIKEQTENKKKLVEVQFTKSPVQKQANQQKRIINDDGIEINESEIMSDNPSIISKQNVDDFNKYKQEMRNLSTNIRSTESLANKKEYQSRQKSADTTPDSQNQLRQKIRENSSNQSSPNNQNKKRVEKVLDKNLIAKVEFSQQQIEQTIQQTLQKLEQVEQEQLKKDSDKQKVNITKRKSDISSQNSQHEKDLSEISQNYSFAESDFSQLTGNGQYATRQIIKKNYIATGKVPSRYNHEGLYPPKNKSQNNSFHDNQSNLSSSKIFYKIDNSSQIGENQSNINKPAVPDNKDIIDEEEYQGDIKINRNVNLQKLLFVD